MAQKKKAKNHKKIIASPRDKQKTISKKEDWVNTRVFIILGIIFIIVQTLGLLVAQQLFLQGQQQTFFNPDMNDISNAAYLFGSIIVMTIILLILLRLRKTRKVIWLVEAMAIFATTIVVFSAFLPTADNLVLLIALIVLAARYYKHKNIWIKNITSVLAIAGAGALIGISLGLIPILAFIIALAIYDIIAVFYTKHMITIAKSAKENNFAFMMTIPTKKHVFELGNGDLIIPLLVAASILANSTFHNPGLVAGIVLGASFVGLMSSIYMVGKMKIAMPALPPQTLLMVIVIITAMLLGA